MSWVPVKAFIEWNPEISLSLTTTQPLPSQPLQRTTTLVTLVLFPLQTLTLVGNQCVHFDDRFILIMKMVTTEMMLYTSLDVIILRYTALVVVLAEGLGAHKIDNLGSNLELMRMFMARSCHNNYETECSLNHPFWNIFCFETFLKIVYCYNIMAKSVLFLFDTSQLLINTLNSIMLFSTFTPIT